MGLDRLPAALAKPAINFFGVAILLVATRTSSARTETVTIREGAGDRPKTILRCTGPRRIIIGVACGCPAARRGRHLGRGPLHGQLRCSRGRRSAFLALHYKLPDHGFDLIVGRTTRFKAIDRLNFG